MKQTQVVMTADLARYLINQGFNIIDLDAAKRDSKQTVFIFKYSDELQKAMDIYFATKKQRNKNLA